MQNKPQQKLAHGQKCSMPTTYTCTHKTAANDTRLKVKHTITDLFISILCHILVPTFTVVSHELEKEGVCGDEDGVGSGGVGVGVLEWGCWGGGGGVENGKGGGGGGTC